VASQDLYIGLMNYNLDNCNNGTCSNLLSWSDNTTFVYPTAVAPKIVASAGNNQFCFKVSTFAIK
jgi:hypothetical protein